MISVVRSCVQGLSVERANLIHSAPPHVRRQLPCLSEEPSRFTELVLGTCWIDDSDVHSFCVEFLSKLKRARAAKLL